MVLWLTGNRRLVFERGEKKKPPITIIFSVSNYAKFSETHDVGDCLNYKKQCNHRKLAKHPHFLRPLYAYNGSSDATLTSEI